MRKTADGKWRLWRGALLAAGAIYLSATAGAWAVDIKCVEPSRYKNLLQVFDDNPELMSGYFGLDRGRVPDMNACRAAVLSGTIRDGDDVKLIEAVIQNKGWLDVLYLSFDGIHLMQEVKLARIVRGFALKTVVLKAGPFRYEPDFATLWGAPAASGAAPGPASPPPLSSLDRGLQEFAKRRDLGLPIARDRHLCIESCAGVWMAGLRRVGLPVPPIALPPRAAAAAPEIVSARPRAALIASLDNGKLPPPNDAWWRRPLVAGDAPVLPPPADRMVRARCDAELVAGDALVGRIAGAAEDLARNDYHDVRSKPPALLEQFDAVRMAGVRLEACVVRAFEAARLSVFRRFCTPNCDKAKLVAGLDRAAHDFIDHDITLAALFGAGADNIGREWRMQGVTATGVLKRRGDTAAFDAVWMQPDGKQFSATVEIARSGDRVALVLVGPPGRCVYQGAVAADNKSARGTFICSWVAGAYAWNATIAETVSPSTP